MARRKGVHPRRLPRSSKPILDCGVPCPLAGVQPLLGGIISTLGTNAAVRLIDSDRAQMLRWKFGHEPMRMDVGRRIVDLHDLLTRILRVYDCHAAAMWFVGSEPLLGGARPIDLLAMGGVARVIRTVDGITEGAYA